MKHLIYLIILTTIGCTSNKYNNAIGITTGEAIALYEIKLKSDFVYEEPPSIPIGIYGVDSKNQEITLFFKSGKFKRNAEWKSNHFNNKIIVGITIKSKEKEINYGNVPFH